MMMRCIDVGFYTYDSITRANKLWEIPVKITKTKRHYCLHCKASAVTNINERICDNCKKGK